MAANCTIDSAYMKPGMKLVRAAVSSKGAVVAPAGAILTVQLVNAIMDADIRALCIQDDPALKLPPESRLDDDVLGAEGAAGGIATPESWIAGVQGIFTACIREKRLEMETIKDLWNYCFEKLKSSPPFSLLVRNDPAANYVYHHTLNSSVLSAAVAQALGLPENDIREVFTAALLHDIGMPQVAEHMWLTAKPISKMFREEIEKHATLGFRTLERLEGVNPLWALAAQDHHERLDGSGYPNKKPAAQIPMAVRIVSACDAYAAMISPRIYRAPIPPDKAIKALIAQQDKFDRAVIGRLVQKVGIFPVGCRVKLSDGSAGGVMENKPTDPLRPVVQVLKSGRAQKIDVAQVQGLSVIEIIPELPSGGAS